MDSKLHTKVGFIWYQVREDRFKDKLIDRDALPEIELPDRVIWNMTCKQFLLRTTSCEAPCGKALAF